jgi:hypothetical protein
MLILIIVLLLLFGGGGGYCGGFVLTWRPARVDRLRLLRPWEHNPTRTFLFP